MYTPNRSIEGLQTPSSVSSTPNQPSQGPTYHVYSHYGCRSEDIDSCLVCKSLLQQNVNLHSSAQSLISATKHCSVPIIKRQLSPTPIKPVRHRIDDKNDVYLLQDIPGSSQDRRKAEDTAILNICLKDKSIGRIILVDADEEPDPEENDEILYLRLYDLEKRSN